MGFETVGAKCPHCNKETVWSKIEPNSMGAFQFDACLSCGFIDFETNEIRTREETNHDNRLETWVVITKQNGHNSIKSLLETFAKASKDPDAQTAFSYKGDDPKYIESCVIPFAEVDQELKNELRS